MPPSLIDVYLGGGGYGSEYLLSDNVSLYAVLCQCGNMAREGLRTLVVAKKSLSEEQYQDFEVLLRSFTLLIAVGTTLCLMQQL